ncbi:efflux RND transporter periplasmic adaptor subunit [Saccharibacter sp. 17.LH.SD]|uniref:efflux RND transporter periplasmic adaptor subunit n=1 Tax=Saccharibacter sp. 17.LH.SD TaxID=2689393 RepID=UPI00136E956D|nr:efflux RND transporter periplasmic adaptor subunit [Saccharibacter sp. 17.LH.SD]MXV43941.1 efflux RND transporter periplasmic adaptor subunit [Saccharibacter sp. 17.LH.SD]
MSSLILTLLPMMVGFSLASSALAEELPFWRQPVVLSVEAQRNEGLHYAPVTLGDIAPHISAMASILANRAGSVAIHPAGEGKVAEILALPGQIVRKGQGLLVYTDHSLHELHLAMEQASSRLEKAQAFLKDARFSYQRGVSLLGASVSQGELSTRRARLNAAQSDVESQRAEIQMLEHRMTDEFTSPTEKIIRDETSLLKSPVDGSVEEINTAVNNTITPSDIVISVTDTSTIWAVAFVRQEDIAQISLGSTMILSPAGAMAMPSFTTYVKTIESVVDPMTGLVRVMATLNDPTHRFRPGMQLDATLLSSHPVHGLIIPAAALQEVSGHMLVYTKVGQDHFQPHMVVPVVELNDHVVVTGDIKPNDQVVAQGSFSLKSVAFSANMEGE